MVDAPGGQSEGSESAVIASVLKDASTYASSLVNELAFASLLAESLAYSGVVQEVVAATALAASAAPTAPSASEGARRNKRGREGEEGASKDSSPQSFWTISPSSSSGHRIRAEGVVEGGDGGGGGGSTAISFHWSLQLSLVAGDPTLARQSEGVHGNPAVSLCKAFSAGLLKALEGGPLHKEVLHSLCATIPMARGT